MRVINVLSCLLLLSLAAGAGISADSTDGQTVVLSPGGTLHAQEIQENVRPVAGDGEKKQDPSASLYQVLGVVLIIWIGLALFIFRLDRRVAKLEQRAHMKQ